jgi:serine protease Do
MGFQTAWLCKMGRTLRHWRFAVAAGTVSVLVLGCELPMAWGQESPGYQAALVVQDAIVAAIARAERSVVAIARVRKQGPGARIPDVGRDGIPLNRAPAGFPDASPTNPDFVPNEFGTGVVIDREGHIVTNYHVLGNPDENDYYVWVQRRPFRVTHVEVPQKVRAGDPWTDLAVLQISADNLEPIQLGDASALRKGMLVIALGNPYALARDGEVSASWGIVSNLRRAAPGGDQSARYGSEVESLHQYGTLIETDARLNLGTSGGALVNLKGEMIGLTTSLAALSGYEQPAGFAIPVDEAFRQTVETLKQGRLPAFGFLGVQPEQLPLADRQQGKFGAQVVRVVPGTPADRAGIREEDIITHVNGEKVYDKNTLFRELSKLPAGTHAALTLERRDPLASRRTIIADVLLSKKYIETAQKPYAEVPDPTWRGLRVEYPSALPPQLAAPGNLAVDREGCVAVLEVERDSPAWKAGLRRGDYISHVGSVRVDSPQAFYTAVAHATGAVRLRLTGHSGDEAVRIVPEAQ